MAGGRSRCAHAEAADYDRIAPVVDEWWGGREMIDMLPRLFFVHFGDTAFVAEDGGELAGFLAGFLSQTRPDEAYIHFAGVSPDHRGRGVGRLLYERFFAVARERSRTVVRCVTSPVNERSIAFHRAMGFDVAEVAPKLRRPRRRQGAHVEAAGVNKRGLTPCIHSHSIVPGGFDEMSSATRLTPATSLMMRLEMRSSTS